MAKIEADVLVVGGGFAGRTASRTIGAKGLSVLLVDRKPFFEFTPSILRASVAPRSVRSITRDHRNAGKNTQFLCGTVSSLTESSALVELGGSDIEDSYQSDGAISVSFKYCVWAGGSKYSEPIGPSPRGCLSIPCREAELGRWLKRVETAQNILVLGAGLVGVELAAELSEVETRRQNKRQLGIRGSVPQSQSRIWLAAPGGHLIPRLPERASRRVRRFLDENGVTIVNSRLAPDRTVPAKVASNTRVDYVSDDDAGLRVSADLVFDCTGPQQSSFADPIRRLARGHRSQSAVLTGRAGLVNVRDTLQLPEFDNVFVAGDAAVVREELKPRNDGGLGCEKTAYAAIEAGRLAAENIWALARSNGPYVAQSSVSLKRYPFDAFPGQRFPRLFAVSLGRWDGVICLGPLVIGGPAAALCKFAVQGLCVRAVDRGGLAASTLAFVEWGVYHTVHLASRWFGHPEAPYSTRATRALE